MTGERVLEGARPYAAGTRETHEFDIALPDRKPTPTPASSVGSAKYASLKSKVRPQTRLQWRLEVRLVAKGIDLVTAKPLTVNIETL